MMVGSDHDRPLDRKHMMSSGEGSRADRALRSAGELSEGTLLPCEIESGTVCAMQLPYPAAGGMQASVPHHHSVEMRNASQSSCSCSPVRMLKPIECVHALCR